MMGADAIKGTAQNGQASIPVYRYLRIQPTTGQKTIGYSEIRVINDVGDNVALGKTVTHNADTSRDPSTITDGIVGGYNYWFEFKTADAYVDIDMSADHTLSSVEIVAPSTYLSSGTAYFVPAFIIQGSLNGVVYDDLLVVSGLSWTHDEMKSFSLL